MWVNRLLCALTMITVGLVTGSASTILPPGDPDIILDVGGASDPLTVGTNFVANANGGGTFDYYNPFGSTITALTFDVTIVSGLNQSNINTNFACSTVFFLTCDFLYTSSSGLLTIDFSGVVQPVGLGLGPHEGIPPLLPGCAATPDTPPCSKVGHFTITINGWSSSDSPDILPGQPEFTASDISTNPEPATGILFGSVLLFGAAFGGLRTRRRG